MNDRNPDFDSSPNRWPANGEVLRGSPEAIHAAALVVLGLSEPTAELIGDEMILDSCRLMMDGLLDGKWQHVRFSFYVLVQP